jgi:hypothetical protein
MPNLDPRAWGGGATPKRVHTMERIPSHPTYYLRRLLNAERKANEIREHLRMPPCVAVGELGRELRFVDRDLHAPAFAPLFAQAGKGEG